MAVPVTLSAYSRPAFCEPQALGARGIIVEDVLLKSVKLPDQLTRVSKGISPELLKWKGIEATERLADSPNSKLVIMGNGKDQLPVILNGAGT